MEKKNKETQDQSVHIPDSLIDDDFDLWELILPAIKYKVQLFLIFLIGIVLVSGGVLIFGEYQYSIQIKYNIEKLYFEPLISNHFKSDIRYNSANSRQYFLSEFISSTLPSIAAFKNYLQSDDLLHVDSSKKINAIKAKRIEIPDPLIVEQKRKKNLNGIQFSIVSNTPQKTLDKANAINSSFQKNNNDTMSKVNHLRRKELEIQKKSIVESYKASLDVTPQVHHLQAEATDYFYLSSKKSFVIVEYDFGSIRAMKVSNKNTKLFLPGKMYDFALLCRKTPKTLNQKIQALSSAEFILGNLLNTKFAKKYAKELQFVQLETENLKNQNNDAESEMLKLAEALDNISQEIGKLDVESNRNKFIALSLKNKLNMVLIASAFLQETPEGVWTEVSSHSSKGDGQDYNASVSRHLITNHEILLDQIDRIEFIDKELRFINTVDFFIQNPSVQLIALERPISPTNIKKRIKVRFRLNNSKQKMQSIKISDFPNRTLLLVAFACFIFGIFSVYIRVLISRIIQNLPRNQKITTKIFDSIKYWKL